MYSFTDEATLSVYAFGVRVEIPSRYIRSIKIESEQKLELSIVLENVYEFEGCEDRAIYEALTNCYFMTVKDQGYEYAFHELAPKDIYGAIFTDKSGELVFYSRTVTADFEFREITNRKTCNQ